MENGLVFWCSKILCERKMFKKRNLKRKERELTQRSGGWSELILFEPHTHP